MIHSPCPRPTPGPAPVVLLHMCLTCHPHPTSTPHPPTYTVIIYSLHVYYSVLVSLSPSIFYYNNLTTSDFSLHVSAMEVFGYWGTSGTCGCVWQESGRSVRMVSYCFCLKGYISLPLMSDDTTVAHIQVTQLKIEEAGGYVLVWLRIEFRHLQIGGAPPYQCYQSRSRRRNWLDGFLPMMSIWF